jgi:3',5'-cyclic-AMP phosphodiesterase
MKIIQLSDTHLVPSGTVVNGVDPEQQLRRAVDDILVRHADADLLVVTGDLCNDGEPAAYALLREILEPIRCSVRLLLGNHDDRPNFRAAFPEQPLDPAGFVQSHLDTPFGRLLFLDTHERGVIGGIYGADRQTWLANTLGEAGDQPVTVFVHHPPADCGIAHFEHIGLHDDGAMLRLLEAHPPGVRQVVFGHIHMQLGGTSAGGVPYSSGQSCAHRFVTEIDAPNPWWTDGNPCYRIIHLDWGGFRAYAAEVGQAGTVQAAVCAGP